MPNALVKRQTSSALGTCLLARSAVVEYCRLNPVSYTGGGSRQRSCVVWRPGARQKAGERASGPPPSCSAVFAGRVFVRGRAGSLRTAPRHAAERSIHSLPVISHPPCPALRSAPMLTFLCALFSFRTITIKMFAASPDGILISRFGIFTPACHRRCLWSED